MAHRSGNLLSVEEGIIVHGCNAQGVMGSGVAAAVRETYPQAYEAYRALYQKARDQGLKDLPLGKIAWFRVSESPKLAIANAITQQYYGRDSNVRYVSYEAIEEAFGRIAKVAREHQLPVHYPLIGAGLANGDWSIIADIIDKQLEGVQHTLWTLPGMSPPARRSAPRP